MRYPNRGYSLLEMLVSIGLFSFVMLLATGAFLKFMALDRIARYTNDVTNNLSFAVDSMSRSIRTGSNYKCNMTGTNCWPSGGNSITFTDDQGRLITYRIKSDGSIGRCTTSGCTATNAVSLTDKRITIEKMKFHVRGVGTGDGMQPMVLISIQGFMQPDPNNPAIEFSIQTMAVQRFLEL